MASNKKKNSKISSRTALYLSSAVLAVCVALLIGTVITTAHAEPKSLSSLNQNEEIQSKEKSSSEVVQKNSKTSESVQNKIQKQANTEKPSGTKNSSSNSNSPEPNNAPKIYIVLDDGGHNISQLESFMNLPFPFAVAVLPNLSHSRECAKIIVENNKILMLHQPMQAINLGVNPGPGSIQPEMTQSQAISTIISNIDDVTSLLNDKSLLSGMNNHEGSLITENEYLMKAVLQLCKDRKLFFLDSRTNSKSVCRRIANDTGVEFYERNIFLDNEDDAENMKKEFKRGIEIARKNGSVIMIGHVWSGNKLADVLQKMYSEYSPQGFEFVSFSK